jgi:hypothetical protein
MADSGAAPAAGKPPPDRFESANSHRKRAYLRRNVEVSGAFLSKSIIKINNQIKF